jgi:hypothetical protein
MNFGMAIGANRQPILGRVQPVTDPATPMVHLGRRLGFTDLAGWM